MTLFLHLKTHFVCALTFLSMTNYGIVKCTLQHLVTVVQSSTCHFIVNELTCWHTVFVEHEYVEVLALQFIEQAVLHRVLHAEVPMSEALFTTECQWEVFHVSLFVVHPNNQTVRVV